MVELIDFQKDNASQELLEFAGITEPYENLISRVSLEILRESISNCDIESIRYLKSAGHHESFRVGGMPIEEGSSKIKLQDMTMPFDLEIVVTSAGARHLLRTTFTIECRNIDLDPSNDCFLEIHNQEIA